MYLPANVLGRYIYFGDSQCAYIYFVLYVFYIILYMVVNSVVGERITSFMYSKWFYHNLKPYNVTEIYADLGRKIFEQKKIILF